MAEVVTTTVTDHTTIKKVKFAVTSDADGTADATTTEKIDGLLVLVCTDPGATAPTDNWDLELKDSDGVDLLAAQGLNRDTANTEYINSGMGGLARDTLTMSVTNAGDAKTLTVYAYFR